MKLRYCGLFLLVGISLNTYAGVIVNSINCPTSADVCIEFQIKNNVGAPTDPLMKQEVTSVIQKNLTSKATLQHVDYENNGNILYEFTLNR